MNIKNIKSHSKIIIIILLFTFITSFIGYLLYSKQQKNRIRNYVTELEAYEENLDKIANTYIKNESKGIDTINKYLDEQMSFMLTYMIGNASAVVNDKYKITFDGQSHIRNTQTKYLEDLIPPDKFKVTHNDLLNTIKNINSNWNGFNRHIDTGDFSIIEDDLDNLSDNTTELNKIYQQLITDIKYDIESNNCKL